MTFSDKPNGYDSDQGKTQRAGQTKTNDIRTAQSSAHGADDGQRDTDEGGTSFTRAPNDRPAAQDVAKNSNEKDLTTREKSSPRGAALGDAGADILPRSI